MREQLLDPTGDGDQGTNTTLVMPRPQSLAGLTVGLLENGKPNPTVLLRAVGGSCGRSTASVRSGCSARATSARRWRNQLCSRCCTTATSPSPRSVIEARAARPVWPPGSGLSGLG